MSATVAPTQRLAAMLAEFIGRLHRNQSAEWFATVGELELSLTQLKALHAATGDGTTVKELAAALKLSLPATSRAVEGLVQRGLVDRRECVEDRRSRRVKLTAEGQTTLDRLERARLAGLESYVEQLPEAHRERLAAALAPLLEEDR